MDDANAIEEMKIRHLIDRWGYARDNDEWLMLADCFCADGHVNLSWIHAPASEFVSRSQLAAQSRKPGSQLKHVFAAPFIRVAAKRAFSICHVNLEIRNDIDGHQIDMRAWFRFFDLLRKEDDGRWRLYRRTAVYEKDRLDLVDPRGAPPGLFADLDLSAYPREAQFTSWHVARSGRAPRADLVVINSPEARRVQQDGESWLRGEAI